MEAIQLLVGFLAGAFVYQGIIFYLKGTKRLVFIKKGDTVKITKAGGGEEVIIPKP